MDDAYPVQSGIHGPRPVAGVSENHAHGGYGVQVGLVDQGQLPSVQRVTGVTQAQGIENAVLVGVGLLGVRDLQVEEFFVVDGHLGLPVVFKVASQGARAGC
ncbi:hypothetical protein D9M71_652710 [compost metagenome]